MSIMRDAGATPAKMPLNTALRPKLHGRAFYESIGSPKMIIAPMVDRSEFVRRIFIQPTHMADG